MCGINIIINTSGQPVKDSLQAMQEVTHLRGPDASKLFFQEDNNWQIGIGVNRLQVVDEDEESNQPMKSICGKYVLAYNGEVYNYRELKNKLIVKGYKFRTHSDTEVVLLWLQEYGIEGLSSFKGMFAIVYVDLNKNQIIMARDRQGIKPLFYYQTDGELIISSSIKAIEECGLAHLSINQNAINDYLSYRHVMGSYTIYQEVQSQEPGLVSIYDNTLERTTSYFKASQFEETSSLKNILVDTVSLLFEAPTTPGLLLSGGVDSTLLLAILRKELGIGGVNTYTLGSGEDSSWARKAAVQYNSQHHEIPVSIDSLQRLDEFLNNTDQPIADHGAFATWVVGEEATRNSNILLSGAGADELFAGYNRHRAFNYYLNNQRQALLFRRTIKKLRIKGLLPKALRQFFIGLDSDPVVTYNNFLQSHGINYNRNPDILWHQPNSLADNLEEALKFDHSHYLVADVLAITDNATMQHSVEARVPYLYDDILNYANTISSKEKIKNKGKGPLKEILVAYGGLKYTERSKLGFGLPLAYWLRNKQSFWLWEFLLKDSPIFEYVPKLKIYQLLRLHQQGKTDNSMQLWSILVLEKWLKHFYN